MSRELPPRKTPIDLVELVRCYYLAGLEVIQGSPPSRTGITIFAAQAILETGLVKCICNAVGNVKGVAGGAHDWTYYKCGEELHEATAVKAAHDERVAITRRYTSGGRAMASVVIYPKHPWCCFRAFETLLEGATDHLVLLHRRFDSAWQAAMKGDPKLFAIELKRRGYYTAPVGQYVAGVLGCLPRAKAASAQVDWDSVPVMTDAQRESIVGTAALTAATSLDDAWEDMRRERDRLVVEANP